MAIEQHHQRFLAKRKRLIKVWYWIGPVWVLLIAGGPVWFYFYYPLLVNPVAVVSMLENDTLPNTTSSLMAVMLPMMFLLCFGLLIILLVFAYSMFFKEKKYIEIIEKFDREFMHRSDEKSL